MFQTMDMFLVFEHSCNLLRRPRHCHGADEPARTDEHLKQRKNNGAKTTTANQGQRGAKQRRSKQNYGIRLVKLRALGILGVKGGVKFACLGAGKATS